MPKFSVWAKVVGTKYLGQFEADTKAAAEEMAMESDSASVSLCHQCNDECEDPECVEATAEPDEESRTDYQIGGLDHGKE